MKLSALRANRAARSNALASATTRTLLEALRGVTEGDLTTRLDDSSTSTGPTEVAQAFNELTAHTAGLVSDIQDSSSTLLTSCRDLAAVSVEVGQTSDSVAAAISQVTAANAQQVRYVGAAGLAAGEAARRAQAGLVTSETLIAAMQTLDASSQEINGIVEVITRVAHQIRLLSLNAAIEAANAGESGRGFNVIATEVRQLADESRVAAQSVTRLVSDIQAAAAGAATVVGSEARRAFTEIAEGTAIVQQSLKDAAGVSAESATATEMVSRVLAASAQGVSRLSTATRSVANTASELQSVAARFNLVPSLRGRTIAYLQTGSGVDYYEYSRTGAEMATAILGGELVTYDSNFDTETEQANVATAIAAGCDGLLLFPTSAEGAAAAMAAANKAGVPMVVLYGYSPEVAGNAAGFHQLPFEAAGAAIGVKTRELAPHGPVAVITGQQGRGDAEGYLAGFIDGLGDASRVKVVKDGGWDRRKATEMARQILIEAPDIRVLFVQNDDMAAGALEAVDPARVVVTSMNGSPEGLELLRAGKLAATLNWSPSSEAAMAIRTLAQEFDGSGSLGVRWSPFVVCTREDMDRAIPWPPTDLSIRQALATSAAAAS
jgi:ABC-type sugar transport system substrate-binding protein